MEPDGFPQAEPIAPPAPGARPGMEVGGPGRPAPRRRALLLRALRRAWPALRYLIGLALAALVVYVLTGKSGELSDTASYLEGIRWPWLVPAVVLEACAIVSFAGLQRRLLLSGRLKVRMWPLTAITLAGNSMNNSLPAGSAFASIYAFRQYRHRGADDTLAAWTVVAVAVAAGASLAVMAAAGLVVSGAEGGLDLVGYTLLTLVGGMAAGLVAVGVLWRKRLLVPLLGWLVKLCGRFLPLGSGDPEEVARRIVQRLRAVRPRRREVAASLLWALGNWVFDCGCLAAAFVAVGAPVPWRSLLLAYGAGQLAANLPITPGGLGVVEGSMTIAVVAYGGAEASTVAAVLVYRIINFWVSLPVGWSAWAYLALVERRRVHATRGAPEQVSP